ncbi:MAG TPA: DUF4405 domain-containing protein [Armatimonadota bacterium]|jgi:hypothetical protein
MTKARWLKVVNLLIFLLFLSVTSSALLREPLGLSQEAFEHFHEGPGTLLILLVLVHIVLNWSWVRAQFLPKRAGTAAKERVAAK